MILIFICHHLIIWGLIYILLPNVFLLLTHSHTFNLYVLFPSSRIEKTLIFSLLHGLFGVFLLTILVVFSGEKGLLFLKDHIEITAAVS